jgi:ATP-binding cassette subfamily C protein LapB
MNHDIATLIDKAARLAGQRIAGGRLGDLADLPAGLGATALFTEAWRSAGLAGDPVRLHAPTPANLPLAGWRADLGWLLVQGRGADGQWRAERLDGTAQSLDRLDDIECVSLPRRSDTAAAAPRAMQLVWQALLARKSVFLEAVLATGLINLLTLAGSLYAMQVFDRVIPNQGFQTLWVLSVGVALAVCLEFLLKQVRSHMVDKTCNAIDQQLSEWFFNRMMGIRMEARPASVGTLASQVKGFEMVRGVLASTSLFVLADVPFALFFILVIALVGGWVVAVPLIALPIALAAGLIFQRAIQRHTRLNLASNNRKAGLLVEAVDGAESLKANSAEWRLQARWNRLVGESAESDQSIRTYSALAQNLTVALQQLGYVALVAMGAYFVTINELTMGGLLACTIISNRAMMPIVQLPGVMVQWAHARAAIEGLDQIIALPSEDDDAPHALAPQTLAGGLRLERVRFAYGMAMRPALEIERLEIKPGERVGLLGAIGSGKSTLLKLCSGLYRPTEGKLFLGGMDLSLIASAVARESLGYLPQDARMFSGTLRDNLLLGLPDPGDEAILLAAQRTGLIELIGAQPKGLALEITEGGRGVSGGQKQLIMLTRTLLAKPRVWLLDEPTGAMDSVTEARVVNLLRDIADAGATLVAATHKTALLPLFDRLIVLQNGRVLLDGPRDAVLAKLSGRPQPTAQEKLA